MWSYLSYAAILGLTAGISPGPLLAVVIQQTLQHGAGEGIKIALAPLITDIPIIGIAFLLYLSTPMLNDVLGLVSFAGAVFILLLGLKSLRTESVEYELPIGLPRSYSKGILVNALSPHPYLFWFLVGVPTTIKAGLESINLSFVFILGFMFCLIGSKVMVALVVAQSRRFISGRLYRWIMRGLGLCLIAFSIQLFREGMILFGILSGA